MSSFKSKFTEQGKTPAKVFSDKYVPILKNHGWGDGGKKLPKNWDEREVAYNDLMRMMGQKVMAARAGGTAVAMLVPSQVSPVVVGEKEGGWWGRGGG